MIDNNIRQKLLSVYQSVEKESIEGKGDDWVNSDEHLTIKNN